MCHQTDTTPPSSTPYMGHGRPPHPPLEHPKPDGSPRPLGPSSPKGPGIARCTSRQAGPYAIFPCVARSTHGDTPHDAFHTLRPPTINTTQLSANTTSTRRYSPSGLMPWPVQLPAPYAETRPPTSAASPTTRKWQPTTPTRTRSSKLYAYFATRTHASHLCRALPTPDPFSQMPPGPAPTPRTSLRYKTAPQPHYDLQHRDAKTTPQPPHAGSHIYATTYDVASLIAGLAPCKSPGHDGITTDILRT